MKVYIYDYSGEKKEIEITKPVKDAFMLIVSGDQILYVAYTDGTEQVFDSCDGFRTMNYLDGGFFVKLHDGKDFIKEHDNY